MISTPKGMNFFREEFIKGQDRLNPDYESFQYSTQANPHITKKELEDFAKDMPERVYKQEILAQFIEDVGAVFKNVRDHVKGQLEEPRGSVIQNYYIGIDLAKYEDFTVICVLNENGHLVHFDRFNQIDWNFQKAKIINIATRYHNAQVLIDSTGVGDPIYEDLMRKGVRIQGYKFTNESKKQLIENLAIKMENNGITFPDIPELVNELREFGYIKTDSGTLKYQAPEGLHDDCVIALALAVWNYKKKGSRPYIA
jgi:phage FluMu gp28-like protein